MSTTTATPVARPSHERIDVLRWPSEMPLFALTVLLALPIWVLLLVSVLGILYAIGFGAFLFIMHVVFVSHVRGNGVRLGPDQFPELYERVVLLAGRMGLEPVPEAYLMQAGGALNALATRFLRSNMIVLFSDLLEACGPNEAARDMIIAHELGHIRAGHLRWRWLTMPALIVPFLGSALSRAREYTCDRIGHAGAGDTDGALLGLAILAAGGRYGRQVNREALVAQRAHLATGWMTIGEWLSSHPPLARRLAAIQPALAQGRPAGSGALRAIAIMMLIGLVAAAGAIAFITVVPMITERLGDGLEAVTPAIAPPAETEALMRQVEEDLRRIAVFLDAEIASGRALPAHIDELDERWRASFGVALPTDPFDGLGYGYGVEGNTYVLWSSGPDAESGTADDIVRSNQPGGR